MTGLRSATRLALDLSFIQRGPCGGWHWNEARSRRHFCAACIALGHLVAS